jgi:flagellar hook-basal body complex protein FliE
MKIGNIQQTLRLPSEIKAAESDGGENPFGDLLSGFVKQVNQDQVKSMNLTDDFINGKDVELHQVMIAGEKAKTSLDLLMEIRNKSLDMYKELTRMQ